jgi:hypothetical protein
LRIFFTILIFNCCITKSNAQNYFPYKAPKQNVAWIDSMKRIINKGFEVDEKKKNNWKKQLNYVNTCALLGRYWEWAYEKRYVKNMSKALVYYKKIIDLDSFTGEVKFASALGIQSNIYRKLADIYFKGNGVKKNNKLSLQYALEGIGNNKNLYKFYSKRYFKTTSIVFKNEKQNNQNDSIYYFKINPFASRVELLTIDNIFNKLIVIRDRFNIAFKDNKVNVLIEGKCEASMRSQEHANILLRNIKNWFEKTSLITKDLIITNVEVGDNAEEMYIKISGL